MLLAAFVCLTLLAPAARAAVVDVTAADVTTRAFSVVWVSDESATDATVRVFAEPAGTTDLTAGLSVTLASPGPALALGVLKVDVSGLAPDTCYYFQTETTGMATVQEPPAAPFTEVCTEVASTKATAGEAPIVNDLVTMDLFEPDGVTAGAGTLMVVSLPGVSAYPLSAFMGQGAQAPAAVVDLGNTFDPATGVSAEPATDDVMMIRQYRGLLCPNLQSQALTRYRRVPEHDEINSLGVPLTELETGAPCFFADTLCDDTIDILDAQRVLSAFGSLPGDCAFSADLDVVADQVINILDVQGVLNRFGESAPFN